MTFLTLFIFIILPITMKHVRKTKRSTMLRKIPLDQIGTCHPSQTKKKRCLPPTIYSQISNDRTTNGSTTNGSTIKGNPYKAVGCQDGEDHCLLDKSTLSDDVKKDLRKRYLRPRRPKGWDADPDMWLDNFNIQHVMQQYQEAYPWFKFLGIFPIDFSAPNPYKKDRQECLNKEVCSLNLQAEYAKGVRGIGMVFNLDPHFKGGSHWVGLYINLQNIQKPFVGYFDSYAVRPPPLIARLMKSLTLQIKTCELGSNARRYQYGQSECGMFSLYFIICMIHGISFKEFCKDAVDDKTMLQLRKILFSK